MKTKAFVEELDEREAAELVVLTDPDPNFSSTTAKRLIIWPVSTSLVPPVTNTTFRKYGVVIRGPAGFYGRVMYSTSASIEAQTHNSDVYLGVERDIADFLDTHTLKVSRPYPLSYLHSASGETLSLPTQVSPWPPGKELKYLDPLFFGTTITT